MTLSTVTTRDSDKAAQFDEEPRRRLSVLRLLMAILAFGGAGYGIYALVRDQIADLVTVPGTWFAPYVDVTLTPTYPFQLPSNN
ncbi:MAG TPA: hypothetical protein VEJ44_04240, partial [Acidimicrobiales bacterium]|nr:hypothetical protein [Acidimicrobiales bacterium]